MHLRKGFLHILSLSLLGTGLVLFARSRGMLAGLDFALYDRLFPKASVPKFCSGPIATIQANESDLQRYGYPLPGTVTGRVVALARARGAAVVGFGLFRDLPQDPGHQELLEELAAANVVSVGVEGGQDIAIPLPAGASQGGFVDLKIDEDGILRRLPYMLGMDKPTYATAIAAQYLQLPWQDVASRLQQYQIAPHTGPYGDYFPVGSELLVPWRDCRFRTFSFAEVLTGEDGIAAGDIVLVGQAAASVKNPFLVPGGRQFYDAEVFAHLVATNLEAMAGRGTPIRYPGNLAIAIGLVIVSGAQSFAVWQARNLQATAFVAIAIAIALLLAGAATAAYIFAFQNAAYWLPLGAVGAIASINLFILVSVIQVLRLVEQNKHLAREVERQTETLLEERAQVAATRIVDGLADSLVDPVAVALGLLDDLNRGLGEGTAAMGESPEEEDILQVWAETVASARASLLAAKDRIALVSQIRSGRKKQEVTDVSRLIQCIAEMAKANEKRGIRVFHYCTPDLMAKSPPEDLARILLSLIGASLDALTLQQSQQPNFQPQLLVNVRQAEHLCAIEIFDNATIDSEARTGLDRIAGLPLEGRVTGDRLLEGEYRYRYTLTLPLDAT